MIKDCPKLTGIEKVAEKLFNSQQTDIVSPEIEHQKTLVPSAAEKGILSQATANPKKSDKKPPPIIKKSPTKAISTAEWNSHVRLADMMALTPTDKEFI